MIQVTAALRSVLFGALGLLTLIAVACSGGAPTAAQAPQQPAPAAQAQPAAAAADPVAPAPLKGSAASIVPPELAPAPPSTTEGPKYGGILRISHRGDPPAAWDVMRSTNYNNTLIHPAIYGAGNFGMACREDELQVCPFLAESWEASGDFSVWTFKIRDNAFWHDGVPFTAEDAAFWADLFVNGVTVGDNTRQPATHQARFGDLKKLEVLDGNRVRFTLGERDPLFLDRVALFRIRMQHPKHLTEPQIRAGNVDVSPVDLGIVGTGPFKFQRHDKAVAIEVRRFDQYWEKDKDGNQLPYLDGVDFFIITEASAFHAAFRSGRLDGGVRARGFYLPPEMIPSYRKSLGDDFFLGKQTGGGLSSLAFNSTKPPFDDIRVRRAFSLWTDRQSGIDAFGGGFGVVGGLLSGAYWWNTDLPTWPGHNPATRDADKAEARRLMAEAGYPNGLTFSLLSPRTFSQAAEWWQGVLKGVATVNLDLVDVAAHDRRVEEADYVAVVGGISGRAPQDLATELATKDASPYAKVVHYDAKITAFLAQIAQEETIEGRRDVVRELERYVLLDQVLGVKVFQGVDLIPYRNYVKGILVPTTLDNSMFASYATVWLDK